MEVDLIDNLVEDWGATWLGFSNWDFLNRASMEMPT